MFGLHNQWSQVTDQRPQPQIPPHVFPATIFLMFFCRLPSFNELDQYRNRNSWKRYLGRPVPSDDELGYETERIDLDSLREILAHIYTRLMRNKVLLPIFGWRVAAIDGHEIGWSYKRCCTQCLTREVTVNDEIRIQYYHRIVIFQLLGEHFRLMIDAELLRPGEDEVGAATRMTVRVLARFPRSFDILTADALYARAPLFNLLLAHGKHVVCVLKDERRDLFVDSQDLFRQQAPQVVEDGPTTAKQWDLDGFTSWPQVDKPVRVTRSLESTKVRERIGGQWVHSVKTHDWVWVATPSAQLIPTAAIVRFGHARWQVENEGFNELVNDWHADHYFHHHPISIMALWLILFIAHAIFHAFIGRNLKPQIRSGHTTIYWAMQINAEFRLDHWWWPVPT